VSAFLQVLVAPSETAQVNDIFEQNKLSVMVIEDDSFIREELCEMLEDEGYAYFEAGNGQVALDLLKDGVHPNIILLDLMMPVMNGWATLQHLSESDTLRTIPVIVLSAFADRTSSLPAQAVNVLRKPINLFNLISVISKEMRAATA
jgi:CheY-like chemotaxis protein